VRRPGWSLVETVMILALLGLLFHAGTVSIGRLTPKFQLQSAVWAITSGLNRARFRAIWRGEPARVTFHSSGYSLERYDDGTEVWRAEWTASLPGVDIQATNSPIFHPAGTVSSLASVTVSNERGTFQISVAISGRIRTVKVG
jgi:Tfp pilus assembly protein FimT